MNHNIMISDIIWENVPVEKVHGKQEGDSMNQNTMISDIIWENLSYVEAEGDNINQSIMWREKETASTRA